MTTGKALNGKPYAGNPHVRFDEGAGASRHSGRSALLYRCVKSLVLALACASVAARGEGPLAKWFEGLPAGTDPATISRRVTDQFLTTRPENYKPAGYHGNKGYGWNRIVQYSVVSLWMNAIACARLTARCPAKSTC